MLGGDLAPFDALFLEVPERSGGLEGGLQGSRCPLEGSFEARSRGRLRIRCEGETVSPYSAAFCRRPMRPQIVERASTRWAMSASVCSGEGVMRRRSVPRATVG